jgi:hypothetical protein
MELADVTGHIALIASQKHMVMNLNPFDDDMLMTTQDQSMVERIKT